MLCISREPGVWWSWRFFCSDTPPWINGKHWDFVKTAAAFCLFTASLGVYNLKHSLWIKGASRRKHFHTSALSLGGKLKKQRFKKKKKAFRKVIGFSLVSVWTRLRARLRQRRRLYAAAVAWSPDAAALIKTIQGRSPWLLKTLILGGSSSVGKVPWWTLGLVKSRVGH